MKPGIPFFCVVLILFGLLELILGWRHFLIENLNVTAYGLSNKVEANATLTSDNAVSVYMDFKEDVQRLFVKIEFYMDSGNGLFDLRYINDTINVCRFFRDKKYLPVLQLLYNAFLDAGNYPKSCPVKKNLYFAKDVKIDPEKLPPTMPNKQMYVAMTLKSMEALMKVPQKY